MAWGRDGFSESVCRRYTKLNSRLAGMLASLAELASN